GGGGTQVGGAQQEKRPGAGEVADVEGEGGGGIGDVHIQIFATAVNIDVANNGFGGVGDIATADIEHAEDGPGGVPFLPQSGFGTRDGMPRQLPVAVEPVRIADHDDNAVPAITRPQSLGHVGRQVVRGPAHTAVAALGLLPGGGAGAIGVAGGGQLRPGAADRSGLGRPGRFLFYLANLDLGLGGFYATKSAN